MTVEPGRQLAGRYRVEDLLAERAGARLWRAVDEVLRRSVAVDVLPSDAPRASALVQAARRAAVVTDGRFLRVLDAAEENGDVYVVREWAPGESLDLVLAGGPLTHRRAAWIVHEVAEAVSVAHSAGIYHLRLVPENILVTDTGGVKIIGLATDAALHGVKHADAEAEDVRGLGRLLYAALVARWPGGPECAVPTAPAEHGRLLRPAQVRAGVPRQVDEVCDRILGEPPQKGEPLRHASAVAAELSATARLLTDSPPHRDPEATAAAGFAALTGGYEPTAPLHAPDQTLPPPRSLRPEPAVERTPERTAAYPRPGDESPQSTRQMPAMTAPVAAPSQSSADPSPAPLAAPPPAYQPPPSRDPSRVWMWVAVAAIVLALAGVSFYLGFNSTGDEANQAAGNGPGAAGASEPVQPVNVASVSAFDPFGEEGENNEEAPLVLDGDPSTQWTTLSYQGDPQFGGLKPGLGLVLDLGQPREVRRVTLDLGGSGTDLEVRAAPAGAGTAPADPGDFATVGTVSGASGQTTVTLNRSVRSRYLLVWLTKLPPESGGTFRGFVNEITVAG
ncbi:MAG TPA: protein kinase family protein [Nocardioidaceae bacterium]|nr:protein kinase family protein [Nocardioidaceae bacterium]